LSGNWAIRRRRHPSLKHSSGFFRRESFYKVVKVFNAHDLSHVMTLQVNWSGVLRQYDAGRARPRPASYFLSQFQSRLKPTEIAPQATSFCRVWPQLSSI
jgi:hypothetical protein